MIKEAIAKVVDGNSLTMDEAAAVMNGIMSGEVTPSQFGAFVTALRIKGETVDEIAGLAKVMREKAIPVKSQGPLIDVVGTGGDSFNTFNITTTTAFVAAGAGLKVAKHGNRAMSSKCGSADVLEALGVKINLTAEQVQECLDKVGIGFMFAQSFHPSMKYAAPLRPEIGIRTVFNILGPLTNPAGATTYLLGVADASLVNKMAMALQNLDCHHALVVHSDDGLDEVSITANTQVCEIEGGSIKNYMINPENLGFSLSGLDSIKGGTADENATLLRNILSGTQAGPQQDVVLINAAAALFAGDKVDNLQQGVELARETISNGNALTRLEQLVELSKSFV